MRIAIKVGDEICSHVFDETFGVDRGSAMV
jgi:hypothetical protein